MIYKGIDRWNTPHLEHINGFKYIAKKVINGKTRYFYTNDELQAFLNGGDTVANAFKNIRNSAVNFINEQKEKAQKAVLKKKREAQRKNPAYQMAKRERLDNLSKNVELQKKRRSRILAEQSTLVDTNGEDGDHKYLYKVKINGKYRYFYSEDEYQAYEKRLDYLKNEPDFMSDIPRSPIDYTRDEDMIQVNPNYVHEEDYQYNCAECSLIYELRRRGYDVESDGLDYDMLEIHNTEDRFKYFAEDAKMTKVRTNYDEDYNWMDGHSEEYIKDYKEKVDKVFEKMPNGSRGDFSCYWDDGGGHSMVWEKDSKGKVTIYDSQLSGRGKTYVHDIEDIAKWSYDPMIVRTDNITFKKGIKDIIKPRSTPLNDTGAEAYENYGEKSKERH